MFKRMATGFGVLAIAVLALAAPVGAAGTARRASSDVFVFGTTDQVPGAGTSLTRANDGVSFTLHTTLPAGNAETVWWIIFNNPSECTSPAGPGLSCGLGDVVALFETGDNPAEIAILNADGRVVPPTGDVAFSGQLSVGSAGPGETLVPGGLTNPLGAEIHLIVDDHGPAASDQQTRWFQTHTLSQGCGPNGDQCSDVQDAAFPAG